MSGSSVSVVVEGWTFTRDPGSLYVDVTPPDCETSVEAVFVDELHLTQEALHDLAVNWLRENRPNLGGYMAVGRWCDSEKKNGTKGLGAAFNEFLNEFLEKLALPIFVAIIIILALGGVGSGSPESPYYR